ncbi:uncharacterized protein LOC114747744 [Neltuma alba]|uniref:uncharacterized protein LOC114747744 n=1 Tax=Neltuma alba TaxID=207710 RepID=UPI0010A3C2F4|nr:uncharacterized protein LOC114747744 [Prosopis alba]
MDVHPSDIEKLQHLVSAAVPFNLIKWKAFSNVTFLRLNTDKISSVHDDFPRFENLARIGFSRLYDEDLNWVVKGLRSCPKHEVPVMNQIFAHPHRKGRSMEPILEVPPCVSSHLKEFRDLVDSRA